ncbi:MAG: AMP-binding protein [Chloroflexota bacterium]
MVAGGRLVPESLAVRDDDRSLTFGALDRRTDAIARSWRAMGIDEHSSIGLLLLNRVAFLEAMFAAHKLGAEIVFLNTAFAGPQVAEVVASHEINLLVHDRDLADAAAGTGVPLVDERRLDDAVIGAPEGTVPPPARPSRVVVLTSAQARRAARRAQPGPAATRSTPPGSWRACPS